MNKMVMLQICIAMIETVKETGERGAPGGVLYAALMQRFPNLSALEFEDVMSACCAAGHMRKKGECYYPAQ